MSARGTDWLWLLFLALGPLPFVFQGVDVSDMGYAATCYQQIFRDPESVVSTSYHWLANVIGGVWLAAFGGLGYVSLKLGDAVVTWATAAFAYLALRPHFPRGQLLPVIAVTSLYITVVSLTEWIGYDDLSPLFYTAGAACLARGIDTRRRGWLFAAGFALAANAFVRVPSAVGLLLGSAIGVAHVVQGRRAQETLADLGVFALGAVAAVAFVAALFIALGQPLIDLELFRAMASDEAYRPGSQLEVFASGQWKALRRGARLLVLAALLALAFAWLRARGRTRIAAALALAVAACAALWVLGERHRDPLAYSLPGALYIALTAALFVRRLRPLAPLVWLALLQLVLTPLGSSTGFTKACHGLWLTLPLALLLLASVEIPVRWQGLLRVPSLQPAFPLLLALLTGVALGGLWKNSYRDASSRLALDTAVDAPRMRGLWTTPERARALRELAVELPRRIRPGESVLALGYIPAVHYVTGSRPYLMNPWPELLTEPAYQLVVRRALERDGPPDVLAVARDSAHLPEWPAVSPRAELPPEREVEGHTYRKDWEGEFFATYRPADTAAPHALSPGDED